MDAGVWSSSLPFPCPKSPPKYPDMSGKRRELAKVLMLEREIGFLEEELKSCEGLQLASRSCKEIDEFVTSKPDPLIPINQKVRKSSCLWRWFCSGKSCINLSWICCCSGCSLSLGTSSCCKCCSSENHTCSHQNCGTCFPSCHCCCCFGKSSCSKCCQCAAPSCPKCKCPSLKCTKLCLCFSCRRNSCNPCYLCC